MVQAVGSCWRLTNRFECILTRSDGISPDLDGKHAEAAQTTTLTYFRRYENLQTGLFWDLPSHSESVWLCQHFLWDCHHLSLSVPLSPPALFLSLVLPGVRCQHRCNHLRGVAAACQNLKDHFDSILPTSGDGVNLIFMSPEILVWTTQLQTVKHKYGQAGALFFSYESHGI